VPNLDHTVRRLDAVEGLMANRLMVSYADLLPCGAVDKLDGRPSNCGPRRHFRSPDQRAIGPDFRKDPLR
jgi:hypothetical protein